MARRTHEEDNRADRSKIRVFYAEVDGSSQSVQDLMRTLTAAIGRPVQTVALASRANQDSSVGLINDVNANVPSAAEQLADPLDVAFPDEADSRATQGGAKRKRGQGQKVDRNAGIELVPHLDFLPAGNTPLKEYFNAKSPANDMEQVLVLSHYLQHTMGLGEFGPGHILTAFKHVCKPIPADLKGTIRNMKKSKAWLSFTGIEQIRMSTIGDNVVEHELPKSSTNGGNGTT